MVDYEISSSSNGYIEGSSDSRGDHVPTIGSCEQSNQIGSLSSSGVHGSVNVFVRPCISFPCTLNFDYNLPLNSSMSGLPVSVSSFPIDPSCGPPNLLLENVECHDASPSLKGGNVNVAKEVEDVGICVGIVEIAMDMGLHAGIFEQDVCLQDPEDECIDLLVDRMGLKVINKEGNVAKLLDFLWLENKGNFDVPKRVVKNSRGIQELKNLEWDMKDNSVGRCRSDVQKRFGRGLNIVTL